MAIPAVFSSSPSPAVAVEEVCTYDITWIGVLLMEHELVLIIEDLFTILTCERCGLGASSLGDLRRHLSFVSVPAPFSPLTVRELITFCFEGWSLSLL